MERWVKVCKGGERWDNACNGGTGVQWMVKMDKMCVMLCKEDEQCWEKVGKGG